MNDHEIDRDTRIARAIYRLQNNLKMLEDEFGLPSKRDYDDVEYTDEGDDSLYDLTPDPPRMVMYDSFGKALCQGREHRAILLKPGYTLNKAHTIEDVQPHEFEGYPQGGVPVAFKMTDNTTFELELIEFEKVEGDIDGCVVLNEVGLMVWMQCVGQGNGGSLVIISDQ